MANTKRVRWKVVSMKPDGTQYKGYDILLEPTQPIYIEFDVAGATREEDGSIILTPEDLFEMAADVKLASEVTFIHRELAASNEREKAKVKAMKSGK